MKPNLTRISVFIIAILSSAFAVGAAGGNGSSPKGQPFVTIGDQIIQVESAISSLEDQIDMLIGRVDTIEARVGANEDAIVLLESSNASLQVLIDQNITDITAIQDAVTALELENDDLSLLIAANSGDVASLQMQVDANSDLITSLQGALVALETDLISLGSSLQGQIDNNLTLIGMLQDEINSINDALEFQANLAAGTCPSGEAVIDILADGSYVCDDTVGGGSVGSLQALVVYRIGSPPPYTTMSVTAFCPTDYTATGAGFMGVNRHIHPYALLNHADSAILHFYNGNAFSTWAYAIARCARVVP